MCLSNLWCELPQSFWLICLSWAASMLHAWPYFTHILTLPYPYSDYFLWCRSASSHVGRRILSSWPTLKPWAQNDRVELDPRPPKQIRGGWPAVKTLSQAQQCFISWADILYIDCQTPISQPDCIHQDAACISLTVGCEGRSNPQKCFQEATFEQFLSAASMTRSISGFCPARLQGWFRFGSMY